MSQNTLSIQLSVEECKMVNSILSENGWKEAPIDNEYISLRMKNERGSVITLYTSRKIVFQGHEDFANLVKRINLEGDVQIGEDKFFPHIGVDEVGKGDYFGPLVVVACFVDKDFVKVTKSLGVGDSKKFSDSRIMKMYSEMRNYPYYYSSVVYPAEYAELINETKNVGILLARQHSKVIEMALQDLKDKGVSCMNVFIDQFSSSKDRVINELGELGRKIPLEQHHKGESDIAVACASVLARGIFLEEMEKMSSKYDFDFPKGASNVINKAKEFVSKYGEEELINVAKISFKTTRSVLVK